MSDIFAFECFADYDVFAFLRNDLGFALEKRHSGSQGEVINDLMKRQKANLGMVDEDPFSTHHRLRDNMQVVRTTTDVEFRKHANRYLVVVKPELEECFIRCMRRVSLASELPTQPAELRALLGVPNPRHAIHQQFRGELSTLHRHSRQRHIATFLTDLEDIVRGVVE